MNEINEACMENAMAPHAAVREFVHGAIFTLNRPAKLNAITAQMLADLEHCLDTLLEREARLLVIVGRGDKAFSAGTDVQELQQLSHDEQIKKCDRARNLFVRLSRAPIVSVAAINGLAFGGGLELAMSCTLRIATRSAAFSLPEIKLGLLPAYGGTQMLPAIVGHARALEMMLTGRIISAEEALSISLIHRISEDDGSIEDAALRFGETVVRHSVGAVRAIRECVNASTGGDHSAAGLKMEEDHLRTVFASEEAKQGIARFLARDKGTKA
jgi:enoyl-CoA hydratase